MTSPAGDHATLSVCSVCFREVKKFTRSKDRPRQETIFQCLLHRFFSRLPTSLNPQSTWLCSDSTRSKPTSTCKRRARSQLAKVAPLGVLCNLVVWLDGLDLPESQGQTTTHSTPPQRLRTSFKTWFKSLAFRPTNS